MTLTHTHDGTSQNLSILEQCTKIESLHQLDHIQWAADSFKLLGSIWDCLIGDDLILIDRWVGARERSGRD